jgi:hypothetical protein
MRPLNVDESKVGARVAPEKEEAPRIERVPGSRPLRPRRVGG